MVSMVTVSQFGFVMSLKQDGGKSKKDQRTQNKSTTNKAPAKHQLLLPGPCL